jgi:hypothetical protein
LAGYTTFTALLRDKFLRPTGSANCTQGQGCGIVTNMTKLLEHALEVTRALPADRQDDLARAILQLAGEDQPVVELSPEDAASLNESLVQADRGEFASNDQVRAIWAKHGL